MKRFFTLTLMLFCFILHGFAFDYTDENGVTWTCEDSYNNEATLTSATNYQESVQVPQQVVDNFGQTYTVVAMDNTFKDSRSIKIIYLPETPIRLNGTFSQCSNLERVINSEYISDCGTDTFNGCVNLTEISLSYQITYIGIAAFEGCTSLKFLDLTNVSTIASNAFNGCTSLNNLNLSNVKEIDYSAFEGCTGLTNLNLANVTSIGSAAFKGCSNLTDVIISDNITSIENYVFQGCTNLTNCKSANVTHIGDMAFEGCASMTNFDFTNVTSIDSYAFKDCTSLISLNLPSINSINIFAFEGCTSLKEITCSSLLHSIKSGVFKDCKSLTNFDFKNITSVEDYAFNGCKNLTEVYLWDNIISIGDCAFSDAEKITINSKKVPAFAGGITKNTVIFVPSYSLEAFKKADVWNYFSSQILSIETQTKYEVKTKALNNAPGLLQQLDKNNLNNVVELKVSGTINSYDIMLFRNKMTNLHLLDLSDADIVANPYEYYEGCCTQDSILDYTFRGIERLRTIYIPKSIKTIGKEAFKRCYNLKNVIFQEEQNLNIETEAFAECGSLQNINLPKGVTSIGEYAFYYCVNLTNIELYKGLTAIGESAFANCNLKSITLPEGITTVPLNCFAASGVKHIELPSSLTKIEEGAFAGSAIDSISLPAVKYIGNKAFSNTNLKEVRVPSTLEKIGDEAFSNSKLEKVYAYTILPISISQNTFSDFENIALYVPTQSVDNYYLNTQWSQFKEIHEFNEPYKYFYLDKEFTLEDKRFDGTPDIDIKEDGGLKVDGKDNQEAGDVTIKGDGDKGNSGTLITDGNLNAKKMRFDISVSDNKWYFFSFPFDIKLSDTKAPGEYKWKMYDGSIRADQGSGGWVNLPDNEEWLKQGKGYIFQTNKAGTLTLKVTKEKFGQLDANNIMKELDVFPSGNNFDASWNFIGNPQTSYYNVNDLGYEAPITVWNGNSYEAVRPGDDDYTLHPFQAFFVQKPTASSTIEFKAEDRLTKTGSEIRAQETKARRLARGFVPSRMIINLNVSDGSLSDKTRVVFNDKKSRNYEMDCDAAKFMTLTQAPQLYSVEGKGTKFAINERPMGSVQLGFTAKKSGTFTISAVRMDQPMLLKDNVAGITIDLTNGDYEFTSEAGTFNKRFLLTPNSSVTSIADVVKKTGVNILPTEEGIQINGCNGKNVDVYNLNGAQVASSNSDGMLRLSAGVYIVKVNGMSTKVMVK